MIDLDLTPNPANSHLADSPSAPATMPELRRVCQLLQPPSFLKKLVVKLPRLSCDKWSVEQLDRHLLRDIGLDGYIQRPNAKEMVAWR
jgi:hypothetical protein